MTERWITKEDFEKAKKALEEADVGYPYLAVVDPKYKEEDVIRVLERNYLDFDESDKAVLEIPMDTSLYVARAIEVHKAQKAVIEAEIEEARNVCAVMPLQAPTEPAGEFK